MKDHRKWIDEFLIHGLPKSPSSKSTKAELRREIDRYRKLLDVLRINMLGAVVDQLHQSGPHLITPRMLRDIADNLDQN